MRADDVRRAGEKQGVAVGRRLRHEIGADGAARAGLVLHEELAAELLGQARREHARRRVGEAAGRERHYDAHRPRRIGLRQGSEGNKKQSAKQEAFHVR
jgi:hypothetical protein